MYNNTSLTVPLKNVASVLLFQPNLNGPLKSLKLPNAPLLKLVTNVPFTYNLIKSVGDEQANVNNCLTAGVAVNDALLSPASLNTNLLEAASHILSQPLP